MLENDILSCLTSFSALLDTNYLIHLGHSGKTVSFKLGFSKNDCYHLMGLHHLRDRKDNRGRNYIFDELLKSEKARKNISSSKYINQNILDRIHYTGILEQIIDDNDTIFRYNPKSTFFYSTIKAEYLLDNSINGQELYIFLDKRECSDERFCRSLFPKSIVDYTNKQTKWTLLYKEKIILGKSSVVLFHNKNYKLQDNPT